MSQFDNTGTPAGMTSVGTSQASPQEEKSAPYNLYFAGGAIAVGLIAYVATIIAFRTALEGAAVTGTLGALFTLIGTVSGAYFGVKRSSDTEDKANKRVQEATRVATNAAGALDSKTWEDLKGRGLL
jgi:hypothetical protein